MLTELCCFYGRHFCVERVIRCFLNQDFTGRMELLLYNNSCIEQVLDKIPLPENKTIKLINNCKDLKTGKGYTNVGDIFRDAMTFVDEETIAVNYMDSDDIYLPQHASEGYEKLKIARKTGGYLAYKPYYSYYLHDDNKAELCYNNMEPSVFCCFEYIKEKGFNSVNSSYHQKWLSPLQAEAKIWQPVNGLPTFIYCWEAGHGTHKISGLGDSKDNFRAHRDSEQDHGDGILSPAPQEEIEKYYNYIKHL